jgi:post-segregation antitoxin (ccd killing protein)
MTTTDTEERVIVSAQVPAHARDELERRAREADITLSAEIRRAIAEHLGRDDGGDDHA